MLVVSIFLTSATVSTVSLVSSISIKNGITGISGIRGRGRVSLRQIGIRLTLALDDCDGSKSAQDDIYQRIIQFRKSAKNMSEDERTRLEKRIADYSNASATRT